MIHSDISPSIESDRNSRETERCQVASRRGYVTTKRKAYVRSDRGACNVVGSRTMRRGRVVVAWQVGFLYGLFAQNKGGILADDMGLGKVRADEHGRASAATK